MCVSVYACMCVCVCMYLFVCMWRMCVRIFQLFQSQVAYRMKNVLCVYECVRACVCVCVANGCTYIFDSLGSEGVNVVFTLRIEKLQILWHTHEFPAASVRNRKCFWKSSRLPFQRQIVFLYSFSTHCPHIFCLNLFSPYSDIQLRLRGGNPSEGYGRVEVRRFRNETWGTICYKNGYKYLELSHVICMQLDSIYGWGVVRTLEYNHH